MALKKFSKSKHSTMSELNITPLLDLAFVLLVIFIITTAPMVNDLDLNLPPQNAAKPTNAPPKPNLILVESDGRINFNGREETLTNLFLKLAQMEKQDTNTTVVVYGDDAVVYQRMVNVFDILQRADITKVGMAAERPAAPTL
jgi:biopolymer transport protein ExbD